MTEEDTSKVVMREGGGKQLPRATQDAIKAKRKETMRRKREEKMKQSQEGGSGDPKVDQAKERLAQRKQIALKKFKGFHASAKWMPIGDVKPYEKNPKKHPPEQIEKIAISIATFNFDQPIVVDQDMIIIKGHGRYLASQKLGLESVPVVVRTDLSDNEVRASRIADNQTAESYWHIGNLLREIEVLYGADTDLGLTGYDDSEIRTMYPGLLETEADFELNDSEGTIPSDRAVPGADGLVGRAISKTGEGAESLSAWVNTHNKIIIPFSGDRMGLAALCWAINSDVSLDKTVIVDTFFGQRLWRWHDDYLKYISESLKIEVVRSDDRVEEWHEMIKQRGYPSKTSPWCCNMFRGEALKKHYKDDPKNSVVIWGQALGDEDKPVYRQRGMMQDTEVRYAAPFHNQKDEALTAVIESTGVLLNPLYKKTDMYLCPGCPRYSRPDFVFLKEQDLDLWIRWMVYFGRSQFCKDYVEDMRYDDQALDLIGDGIEAREYGTYRNYAQELPDCPQPDRDHIRPGDEYGWDKEADAKLPEEGRLDRSRGKWWIEVGKTPAFKEMEDEVARYKEERGDMPLEDWLTIKIKEAKEKVREEESKKPEEPEAAEAV